MRFETLAIHAGERPDKAFGAVSVPIYLTSTFVFEDIGKTKGYDYSRTANPTRKILRIPLLSSREEKQDLLSPLVWLPKPPSYICSRQATT